MTTTAEVETIAEAVAEDHAAEIAEADQLLMQIAAENRSATHAEKTYFQQRVGWDEKTVASEVRRAGSVLRLRQVAGTAADRQAVAQEAEQAEKALASEGPKLSSKISELEVKLRSLESAAKLSSKRAIEQAEAAAKLRELVPRHIRESVRAKVNSIDATIGREISEAEIRENELACVLDPSRYADRRNGREEHLAAVQRFNREAVIEGRSGGFIKRAFSGSWPAIRSEAETELAEIRQWLPEMRQRHAELIEQAERPLTFYSR